MFLTAEYQNVMGRIIAVNLAHWRKHQQKKSEQAHDKQRDKREYHENVQEMIEIANQGRISILSRTNIFAFNTFLSLAQTGGSESASSYIQQQPLTIERFR